MTADGQVTVPPDVREALGLAPGDAVAFEREGDEIVVRKADETSSEDAQVASFRARLEQARTRFPPVPLGMSVDEYMAMIREPVPLSHDT